MRGGVGEEKEGKNEKYAANVLSEKRLRVWRK